jgi:hypothetical protein
MVKKIAIIDYGFGEPEKYKKGFEKVARRREKLSFPFPLSFSSVFIIFFLILS